MRIGEDRDTLEGRDAVLGVGKDDGRRCFFPQVKIGKDILIVRQEGETEE